MNNERKGGVTGKAESVQLTATAAYGNLSIVRRSARQERHKIPKLVSKKI